MYKKRSEQKTAMQKSFFGKWVSIDPGISGTGWALWTKSGKYLQSGSISPSRKRAWFEKAEDIALDLADILPASSITRLAFEQPWASATSSFVGSTALTKGDATTLAISTGIIIGILAVKLFNPEIIPVRVIDWKGNLDKKKSTMRVKRLLQQEGIEPTTKASHEIDALGIGLYLLGKTI